MKARRTHRRLVVRGGRRYVVCGLLARRPGTAMRGERPVGMWLPGVTLVLVVLFSAYVIDRPPTYPLGIESTVLHGNAARFTIDDFVRSSR